MTAGAIRRGSGFRTVLRRLARGCLALAPAVLPACYHYVPLQSDPAPGIGVEVELNDLGRVEMQSAVGPEAGSIQGVIESRSDTGFVVSVTQVTGEYGGITKWGGERVAVRPEYVRSMRERQFSTTRTVIASVAAGGAVVAFALTRSLLGIGGKPSSSGNGGNGNTQ